MIKEEALKILEKAPIGDKSSKVNPNYSMTRAVSIIKLMVEELPPESRLRDWQIKRVYQVAQNKRRPRY